MSSKVAAPPPVPVVNPAPTREQVAATKASTDAKDAAAKVKAVTDSAEKTSKQQGVYNNIKTSMSGDWYYRQKTKAQAKFGDASGGSASYAKFGAAH